MDLSYVKISSTKNYHKCQIIGLPFQVNFHLPLTEPLPEVITIRNETNEALWVKEKEEKNANR